MEQPRQTALSERSRPITRPKASAACARAQSLERSRTQTYIDIHIRARARMHAPTRRPVGLGARLPKEVLRPEEPIRDLV